MTQSAESSPVGADLARLVPSVVPVEGADPELVAIGERYWALAGFMPEPGPPVWCEKVRDIPVAGWGRQLYAVAAAGVRAVVPERDCPGCGGVLSLTSRTALQQIINDEEPLCVECTPSLLDAIRFVTDPARKAKRARVQEQERVQRTADDARAKWSDARKRTIAEVYPAAFPRDGGFPEACVREMATALALLRYAPSSAPISGVGEWLTPLHPETEKAHTVVASTVRSDLLAIHPSSPPSAFVWDPPTFERAVDAAGGDLDAVAPPKLTGSYYPLEVSLFASRGSSAGMAAKELDDHLTEALRPAHMTGGRQDDLLALARELIAGEAVRYFGNRLGDINLPDVPDNHAARLAEAADKVAGHRSLGEIYNLAWRATRTAAEAAQKNPRASRADITAHAVNQFESLAMRAIEEPDRFIKPFSEIQRLGVAAMTRVVFYNVLDTNPFEATISSLRASLPPPAPGHRGDADQPVSTGRVESTPDDLGRLAAHPELWNPGDVPLLLHVMRSSAVQEPDVDERILNRAAARLANLYTSLERHLGERHAAIAVIDAAELLSHPLSFTAEPKTSGQLIREALLAFLQRDDAPFGDRRTR
ncbi:hypothetical protein [Streptomyces sp. NPDC003863]